MREQLERVTAVAGRVDDKTLPAEIVAEQDANVRIVVNDK